MAAPVRPLRERVYSRLIVDPSGCVLWSGGLTSGGYGQIEIAGQMGLVHRVVWEMENEPIPDGFEIDHVWEAGCRHRHCAALAHLEPVTTAENARRRAASVTQCVNRHEYTPENTYTDSRGRRGCKECRRAATRRWRDRQAAA